MKNQTNSYWAGLAIALGLILAVPSYAEDAYKIDPGHSSLVFKAKHFNAGYVYGRFNDFSGNFLVDLNNPQKSSVEFSVKTGSVDTADAKRDQHLRSPDFLGAKQFPVITFKSTGAKKIDKDTAEVWGKFTLHGVTRDLKVRVKRIGAAKDPWGNLRLGIETSFTFKRSDHGIKFMPEGVGDEISVMVAVEGILQKGKKHARAD